MKNIVFSLAALIFFLICTSLTVAFYLIFINKLCDFIEYT